VVDLATVTNELRTRALEVGDRATSLAFYRAVRLFLRTVLFRWLRLECVNRDGLRLEGPVVLAPVHRSNLDSALLGALADRRVRALGKESLFKPPVLRWVVAALGAIPVRRGTADREALAASLDLLSRHEMMIVFPEGSRVSGDGVGELFDGTAWLAARSGATVVPIGIAGTEQALPSGAKRLRRGRVVVVVGDPLLAPGGGSTERVPRDQLRAFTAELRAALGEAQADAASRRGEK